jgi:hypothetical protein
MVEGSGERATGTPDTICDLASVLFHALQGGASYDTCIEDAEEAGDRELAEFFRRVRDEDGTRADEARLLLAERTSTITTTVAEEGAVAPASGLAAGAPTTPITGPGQRVPDVPPLRPQEPPPPGTGVGER